MTIANYGSLHRPEKGTHIMSIPTIGPEGGAGDSGAERPRTRKGNKAALVAAIIIGLFALVGVVGTIVVITLAVTGQL